MKKEEFIAALAAEIRDLSKEDIARSLEYYGEMIDERVEDGMSVDEAVDALGGVETVTKEIMAELPRERKAAGERIFAAADRGIDAADKTMEAAGRRIDELGREMGALGEKIGKEMDALGDRIGREMEARYTQYADEDPDESSGEYHITEPFTAVDVQTGSSDVRILRSGDDTTHIETECWGGIRETVEVRDGVLTILHSFDTQEQRKKKGSFFGLKFSFISGGGGNVTVYLADEMWESLSVKTLSGEIEVEDMRARAALLSTKSGDVEARHLTVEGRLELESMSGDIDMDDVTAGELDAHSMSGDVDADGINVGAAELSSKSGDIDMESVLAQGTLRAESTSGDVSLHRCDGRDVLLRSTSGDIDGTLLTPKEEFRGRSVSGDVSLPKNVQEGVGVCEASTTSGDVSLRIAP